MSYGEIEEFCLVRIVMALCSALMTIFTIKMGTGIMLINLVMPMTGTRTEQNKLSIREDLQL
ncbi:NEDD4 binding protein 2 like 2 [Homo sapiens]|uniref:NEDD4 binding protein 2 like 2 n=1 Tax=Homo sapiens TaxID=9606 RepID=A0A6I8PL40_HUMAN|nr:NEDD4 binding protein 2 like 2 [Homo sapiens]KAI4063006.1 NEDD4 binding protein 2 like 2 [Homo sapiens]